MSRNNKNPKDYTDPAQVEKGKKKVVKQRAKELLDLKAVLSTDAGKAVLTRILEHSKMMARNTFTGNSTTFYNLGKREEGLWLYDEIMEADPGSFIDMMKTTLEENERDG